MRCKIMIPSSANIFAPPQHPSRSHRLPPVHRHFLLSAWLYFCASFVGASAAVVAREPPNIMYVLADDMAWNDFGFMGNSRVHTPNLDALASRSARFVSGYVPSSVCRPSLATLLTGLYPHQHGIYFNHGPPGNAGYNRMTSRQQYEQTRRREFEILRRSPTLPAILTARRGYRCLQTGKFWEGHWRNGGFTEGMSLFKPPPRQQTFGGVRILAGGERVAHGNGDVGLQIGRTTLEPIVRFIDECHKDGTPWMVWYAPYLPHQPHDSPEEFYRLARRIPGVAPHEVPYFASIAQFDDSVGKLVEQVRRVGATERTLFVFVSDNGWRPSRNPQRDRAKEYAPTSRSKRSPFDDGLRTPILVRWDGVIAPATHAEPVSSIDLFPTLLSAAGVETDRPESLPGIDLMPVARGDGQLEPSRPVFGEIYPGDATRLDNPERDVAYRWVRIRELKLIVPHHGADGSPPWGGYLESAALFDVESDPDERQNLIDHPEYHARAVRLRDALDAWWDPARSTR